MNRYIQIGDIIIGKFRQYVFEDIVGLSDGDTSRQEKTFVGCDGAEISEIYFKMRSLQIKGHIIADSIDELRELKRRMIKICNPKNKLDVYYYDGLKKYYCSAYADGMPDFSKRQGNFMEFVIYINVPSFYWLSGDEIITKIFTIEPLLSNSFSFPGVFSERVNETYMNNDGEVETYPIIILGCEKPNTADIILENITTGKSLKLSYTMSKGETVTIDMYRYSVTSSLNGSIINQIDRTDNFWCMDLGINHIKVVTNNIYAVMHHRNRYIGV